MIKVIKTRSGTASHSHQLFCVFPQNTTQHFVSFYKFIFPKNIQAVRHSSLSSMPQVQPSRTAQSCKKLKCHCQGQRGGVQSGSTNATSSYRVQNWTKPFVWKKKRKKKGLTVASSWGTIWQQEQSCCKDEGDWEGQKAWNTPMFHTITEPVTLIHQINRPF